MVAKAATGPRSADWEAPSGGYRVHRYYDPTTGQFVSVDPLVDEAQSSYAYAANDPVDLKDCTGLAACTPKVHVAFGHITISCAASNAQSLSRNPTRAECRTAIKILTQYERLCQQYGCDISEERLQELNRKRDEGTITINDLPGTLHREWPGIFDSLTLEEIRKICRAL